MPICKVGHRYENRSQCPICEREYKQLFAVKRNHQRRQKALEILGGKCECCGEVQYEFLCIDHRDGGGNRQRRERGKTHHLTDIIAGITDPYRVLCHNCNMSISLYGYCPHQRE